ncbi:MAG: hypothetical protein IKV99_02705 [Oscillospiraceae bacterium]|nr:hypothetical protein [Oscillospiraceae bacterium]
MTEYRADLLSSAIGNIDTTYLEETLDFGKNTARIKRAAHFPKLSAACLILLLILGFSATAFAISRIPLSWRDIFHPNQTAIGDEDEIPILSQQHTDAEILEIDVVKAISDERVLYLLYSVKANEGAVLDSEGRFASFDLYFPDKMMSGVYQQYFLPRKEGVPENELEGVICADWQADTTAKNLVMTFANWQEEKLFDDVKVDFNVAEISEQREIHLPYGGISLCSADWEDGVLRLMMKGPKAVDEWSTGQNWYFIDTRTDTAIYPEQRADYYTPEELGQDTDDEWIYFYNYLAVGKETLPYLEMHWGGKNVFTTVLAGEWRVTLNETPVTVQSEVLAENVPLSYSSEELLAGKIECSKLSMAIYFADYVDSTTGILGEFEVFDAKGDPIPCDWGFTADQTTDSCMIWTRFNDPIEPESICKLTFNGETVFMR